jgi:hypothetical protein
MDVPLWFADGSLMVQDGADTITIGEYTAKRVDTLTIMSYRDSAQGQIDTAMGLIQFCKKYGKKVVIGCETGNIVPSEPEYVTYYEEGKAYLNQELNNIKTLMQSIYDNYGVSIHHLDPWRKLKN